MASHIKKQGDYELFRTPNDERILKLGNDWFALVKGQKGDILVGSDSDHKKERTLQKGKYKLVEFEKDAKFKDVPHLFLQDGDSYQEAILPKGLPTKKGDKQKYIHTNTRLARKSSKTI